MAQSKEDIKTGRYLSLVLRHNPSAAGILLDKNGWADVAQLIQGAAANGKQLDLETLYRIVKENDKNRFIFNEDHTKIRANQGHSHHLNIDVQLQKTPPPATLFHGTASRFIDAILSEGLKKQRRSHVHLSGEEETARKVGSRHGTPVVLTVDAGKMAENGYSFYLSANGVWLCDHVPPAYLKIAGES